MVSLEDLNLEGGPEQPEKEQEQESPESNEQEAGTESFVIKLSVPEVYEDGSERSVDKFVEFMLWGGAKLSAVYHWIRGTKDFCMYYIQISKSDMQKRTITISSVTLFYSDPKAGDAHMKCLKRFTSLAGNTYRVIPPAKLNAVRGNKIGDYLYLEDLPKLVPELMRDIKAETDESMEEVRKVQGRFCYAPTIQMTAAIVDICKAAGTDVSYETVKGSYSDRLTDNRHYGKENFDEYLKYYKRQERATNNQLVAGTENYSVLQEDYSEIQDGKLSGDMANVVMVKPSQIKMYEIRQVSKNNYRVYLSSRFAVMPAHVTQLCRFFDTRQNGQHVDFVLGSGIDDRQSYAMGSLVSAISSCRATVRAVAAGCCSVSETILWCFAQERTILKYGALNFGKNEIIKFCPKIEKYFDLFLKRAVEIGVISGEDAEAILKNNATKMVMFEDLQAAQ